MTETKWHILKKDAAIIAVSVAVAVYVGAGNAVEWLLTISGGFHWLEAFVSGIFFTSAFTTAPAIVLLGKLAQHGSALDTAFFGGIGALAGDMIIFQLFRDNLSRDFFTLVGQAERGRLKHIFHLKLFRWFTPFIGALIVASPLPDELAMVLMGFSRTNTRVVMLFSFAANFAGILTIALAAKAIQ
ncbi:MAG: hypothetical protein RL681_621 [Candidatus Parcubacteria bacterium]|jgi:hypothetical protein